jgi:hypothetical protein
LDGALGAAVEAARGVWPFIPARGAIVLGLDQQSHATDLAGDTDATCEFRRNPAGDSDLKPATVPI